MLGSRIGSIQGVGFAHLGVAMGCTPTAGRQSIQPVLAVPFPLCSLMHGLHLTIVRRNTLFPRAKHEFIFIEKRIIELVERNWLDRVAIPWDSHSIQQLDCGKNGIEYV